MYLQSTATVDVPNMLNLLLDPTHAVARSLALTRPHQCPFPCLQTNALRASDKTALLSRCLFLDACCEGIRNTAPLRLSSLQSSAIKAAPKGNPLTTNRPAIHRLRQCSVVETSDKTACPSCCLIAHHCPILVYRSML